MLNTIWLLLLVAAAITTIITGNYKEVVAAATETSGNAFKLALGLTGLMSLWLGMMKIAERSGLINLITRAIFPLMKLLYPKVPQDHPAMGSMAMNMAANMFGLNNAATPLGIRAMEDLADLNPNKKVASDAMCMFLAINTSSIQFVPAGAIALLAAGGSSDPTGIVAPTLLATTCSTVFGILAAKIFSKMKMFADTSDVGEENGTN